MTIGTTLDTQCWLSKTEDQNAKPKVGYPDSSASFENAPSTQNCAMSSRRERYAVRMALDPYSGKESGTSDLDELWSGIALTDNEHEVVKALRIISPEISAVSMVNGKSE